MTLRHNNVTVDPEHPSAQGICDRCGFSYNLKNMPMQTEWQGTSIQSLNLKVCETCLDEPNENLRSYSPGPDPLPVKDPRFENADME